MNRLSLLIEAANSPEERRTIYVYTVRGELFKEIKPNGVEIIHRYNDLGQEIELFTSDNSCHYTYNYTLTGYLLQSNDLIAQNSVIRKVGSGGQILKELFPANFAITYSYDTMDRQIGLYLPDGSAIEKQYDAYLRKVIRKNPQNQILYIHEYTKYDLSGLLLKRNSQMIWEKQLILMTF